MHVIIVENVYACHVLGEKMFGVISVVIVTIMQQKNVKNFYM